MLRIGTFVFVLCETSQVFAQTEPIRIEWEAPTGCPNVTYVQDAISRQIATTQSVVPPRPVAAQVSVQTLANGQFQATLTFHSQAVEGHRFLEAENCALLADATALLIALVATRDDPVVTPSTPSAIVTPKAPPLLPALPRLEPQSITPATLQPRIVAEVFGQIATGRTPTAQLGGAIAVGLEWGSVRVEALAEASNSRSSSLQSVDQGWATFHSWGAGVRACYGWEGPDWEVAPCFSGEGVRIAGEASGGLIKSSGNVATELEGWGGLEGRWHVGWLESVFGAEVGGPIARHRYVVRSNDDGAAVWSFETKPVRLRLRLGLALHF